MWFVFKVSYLCVFYFLRVHVRELFIGVVLFPSISPTCNQLAISDAHWSLRHNGLNRSGFSRIGITNNRMYSCIYHCYIVFSFPRILFLFFVIYVYFFSKLIKKTTFYLHISDKSSTFAASIKITNYGKYLYFHHSDSKNR